MAVSVGFAVVVAGPNFSSSSQKFLTDTNFYLSKQNSWADHIFNSDFSFLFCILR